MLFGEEVSGNIEALVEKAYRENLWFLSKYAKVWFHPEDLRIEHRKGHWIWGACNWDLRNPGLKKRIKRILGIHYE